MIFYSGPKGMVGASISEDLRGVAVVACDCDDNSDSCSFLPLIFHDRILMCGLPTIDRL